MRLRDCLEDEEGRLAALVAFDCNRLVVVGAVPGRNSHRGFHLRRTGAILRHHVKKRAHTDVAGTRGTQEGKNLSLPDARPQTLPDLSIGERAVLEEGV